MCRGNFYGNELYQVKDRKTQPDDLISTAHNMSHSNEEVFKWCKRTTMGNGED